MANEAVKTFLLGPNSDGEPVLYTCAAGTTINKGTLCIFSGARTVTAHGTTIGGSFAGIAAADKDGSDASTTIALWTNGIFEVAASAGITAIGHGDQVILSSVANFVEASNVITSGMLAKVVGIAEDSTTGGLVTVRVFR